MAAIAFDTDGVPYVAADLPDDPGTVDGISAVTEEALRAYLNAGPDEALADTLIVSKAMAVDVLSQAYRSVPDVMQARIVLEIGMAVFKRSDSPSGSSQGIDFSSGAAVLGPRDPLAQVWPIIRRYVLPL